MEQRRSSGYHARTPVVLVVGRDDNALQAVVDVLAHNGYAVTRATAGADAIFLVRQQPADTIIVAADLPDRPGIDLCKQLRVMQEVGATLPVMLLTRGPTSRKMRLGALEAGAWDVVISPPDRDELLLKMATFTNSKLEHDRQRRDCMVDGSTGLYSFRGLERRADELRSQAYRDSKAMACVVIAPIPTGTAGVTDAAKKIEASQEIVTKVAEVLREVGRLSDVIGRSGKSEFAILAPSTDAEGAIKLAKRIATEINVRTNGTQHLFELRAGYDAVPNVRERPVEARDLLLRATLGMRRAMSSTKGEWLEPFES